MQLVGYIKNLTRHSAIYTVSTLIQRTQGLILLPILTDTAYLASKSEFGDYTLVYTFIAFMNVVYLYGLDAAFLRYYFLGKHSRKDIYSTAIKSLSATALLTSVLIYLFADTIAVILFNAEGYSFFVKMAGAILFFDTLCNLPYLILRAEERSITYSAVRVGRFVVELILNILFVVYFKLGVKGILYANLAAAGLNLLALLPFQLNYLQAGFSRNIMRDLIRFGLPMIPNGLAYLVVEMSDRYLMLHLLNKETLGLYSANYRFGTLMLLLVSAFRTAWQPFFLKVAGNPEAKNIYARVMTYYTAFAALIVLSGGYMVEYVIKFPVAVDKTLLGPAYWPGVKIIPLILLSYMLYGVYVNLTVGIYIEKKSNWMGLFTGLAALANIGSNFYLMPTYGITGAALATVLAYLVMTLSIYIFTRKIYPIDYEWKNLVPIYAGLFAGLLIYYIVDLTLLYKCIIIAVYILILFSLKIFREDLKNIISGKNNVNTNS